MLDNFIPVYQRFRSWIFGRENFFCQERSLKRKWTSHLVPSFYLHSFLMSLKCMSTNINALVWQYVQRDPAPSYESFLNLPTDGPTSTSERVKNFKNFLA